MREMIRQFCDFLNTSHSPYHVAKNVVEQLEAAGYTRLQEQDAWQLTPGGKFYVLRGDSTVIAFRIPEGTPTGFMMCASHSDHPTFQVKDDLVLKGIYTRLSVEKYGGMIISSWMDRPLSMAGRVLVQTEEGLQRKLIDIDRDLLLIPNVAIHMDRGVNEKKSWNPAVDTLPLVGGPEMGEKLEALLEQEAGGKILGHDLLLYLWQKACVWGVDGEYISSAALDDLGCVWSSLQGFLNAAPSRAIPVLCIFNDEEIGSASFQGAGGTLLRDILKRTCYELELSWDRMYAQSFMISADNGHAIHPNHPEYADGPNAPRINEGIVLKFHANRKYTSDGLSSAVFRQVCQNADVPVQNFYNRADMAGGSTLGNVSQLHVTVPSVDIGLAQLAMHSSYETAGTRDILYLVKALTAYYESALEVSEDGLYTLK